MKRATKARYLGLVAVACFFFTSAHADTVYVSNFPAGHSPTHQYIEELDSSGQGSVFPAGISSPTGLAFDSSGDLYASDNSNNAIVKFDTSGNESVFASSVGRPTDLAFDGNGNLYALAGGGIEKFDSSGNGTNIALNIGFNDSGIACDRNRSEERRVGKE